MHIVQIVTLPTILLVSSQYQHNSTVVRLNNHQGNCVTMYVPISQWMPAYFLFINFNQAEQIQNNFDPHKGRRLLRQKGKNTYSITISFLHKLYTIFYMLKTHRSTMSIPLTNRLKTKLGITELHGIID